MNEIHSILFALKEIGTESDIFLVSIMALGTVNLALVIIIKT
jgi:hypothetical protein